MKKIDLHIHTISTLSDCEFEFSLLKLKEYVDKLKIDCIAITNHNLFNLRQFTEISEALDIDVLPGIEIDLEGGHLLVISENEDFELGNFSEKCKTVESLIKSPSDSIDFEKFKEIFLDLNKYLLIPHYDKKPRIRQETFNKLTDYVFCGEVTSISKFRNCIKDPSQLVPVLFSDMRMKDDLVSFSTRQTFIDLNEISLGGIRQCLNDKNKVSLTKEDGNNFFQATDNGIMLSTGLNVILGQRSTGKTFTLNKISASFENAKYIKQFSLLQHSGQKFDELNKIKLSNVYESYLNTFKKVVEDITLVDKRKNELDLEKYIDSLLKSAEESEKKDSFAKAVLFNEELYSETNLTSLKELIKSVELLINNTEYKEIINKHIEDKNLKALALELMEEYTKSTELELKKKYLNTLIKDIKTDLRVRTSITYVEDIDFYNVVLENEKVRNFNHVTKLLQEEREIDKEEISRFRLVTKSRPFTGAGQLQKVKNRRIAFSEAFKCYSNPYKYLNELKKLDIEPTEYYKFFIDVQTTTLNKHGFPVSGGERSEFNLLNEISDSFKSDILLIDEPESSFDNIFLKDEVNELIKDISKKIPVVVVTHNNTVGASIKPDYVAYTHKEIEDGEVVYKIYSGYPSDKVLKNVNGAEEISNYNIILNCLEAGNEAYSERRTKSYEILKDRE
nr:PHP domain-containing protein [uncultured Draconibacterium sp.]